MEIVYLPKQSLYSDVNIMFFKKMNVNQDIMIKSSIKYILKIYLIAQFQTI